MTSTKAFVLAKITDSSPASRKLTKRFMQGLAENFEVCTLDYSPGMVLPSENLAVVELNDFEFVSVRLPASQPKAVFFFIKELSDCLGEPRHFLVDPASS